MFLKKKEQRSFEQFPTNISVNTLSVSTIEKLFNSVYHNYLLGETKDILISLINERFIHEEFYTFVPFRNHRSYSCQAVGEQSCVKEAYTRSALAIMAKIWKALHTTKRLRVSLDVI